MFTKKRYRFPLVVCSLMLLVNLFCRFSSAQNSDKDHFFSYERFYLNKNFFDKLSGSGGVQSALIGFSDHFIAGFTALSAGKLQEAKSELLKARDMWPEYFGTYFLLALIYEEEGDYKLANRYYKTYLLRLKDLYEGKYRISGALMPGLTTGGIEQYNTAYENVKERVAVYELDIDAARSVHSFPVLVPVIVAVVSFGVLYVVLHYLVSPYIRRKQRMKNMPEGFWMCRHCGEINPVIIEECTRCRKLRNGQK